MGKEVRKSGRKGPTTNSIEVHLFMSGILQR